MRWGWLWIFTLSQGPLVSYFPPHHHPHIYLSTCCARFHKSALAWFSPQVYASFKDVLLYTSNKVQLGHQMEGHLCIASAQTVGRQNSDGIRSVLCHQVSFQNGTSGPKCFAPVETGQASPPAFSLVIWGQLPNAGERRTFVMGRENLILPPHPCIF